MDCTAAMEAISNALDGELSPEAQSQLNTHLVQCPRCRALQAELSGLSLACQEALEVTPPPELKEHILANLPPQTASKPVVRLRWQRWAAMAAAFAVVAVGAWQAVRLTQDSAVPATSPAADEPMYAAADVAAPTPEPRAVITDAPDDATPEAADDATPETVDVELPAAGVMDSGASAIVPTTAGGTAEEKSASITVKNEESGTLPVAGIQGDSQPSAPVANDETRDEPAQLAAVGTLTLFSARREPEDPESAPTEPEPDKSDWTPEVPPDANPITIPLDSSWDAETASEVAPTYCGVLTLPQVEWTEDYPKEVKGDSTVWYYLPAQDFARLLSEKITYQTDHREAPAFTYRYTGEDISPDSDFGLVIVENQD